jgi:hypothetical protein
LRARGKGCSSLTPHPSSLITSRWYVRRRGPGSTVPRLSLRSSRCCQRRDRR